MRIALATCDRLPALHPDYHPLVSALTQRGITPAIIPWDSPDFDWASVDVCMICSTWDYALRRDEFVTWAKRVGNITALHNPPELIAWNTHKSYLRDLQQHSVAIIPTHWLRKHDKPDLSAIMTRENWSEVVIKPIVGAGGRETIRVDRKNLERGTAHLHRTLAIEDMMIQQYFPRVIQDGELSLVYIDEVFTHAVRKCAVPGEFRVQDDHGGTVHQTDAPESAIHLGNQVVRCTASPTLYARVDILYDQQDRPHLVELEIVEPELFLRFSNEAAERLADKILAIRSDRRMSTSR